MNTERTFITNEETTFASRLHTCSPRVDTKQSRALAPVFYHVALFNCGGRIKKRGDTKKSECLTKTQVRGQEILTCHGTERTQNTEYKAQNEYKEKKKAPGTTAKRSPLINAYLIPIFKSFLARICYINVSPQFMQLLKNLIFFICKMGTITPLTYKGRTK